MTNTYITVTLLISRLNKIEKLKQLDSMSQTKPKTKRQTSSTREVRIEPIYYNNNDVYF